MARSISRSTTERSFWLDTLTPEPAQTIAPLPPRVDVAIVGAGFTGLSAALAVAKRGGSVTVLEQHVVGWGASTRNGGMVLTGLKWPIESLLAKFDRAGARALYEASLESIDCVEQIVREESIDCDFSRGGHLEVACKRSHLERFRRTADTLCRDFDRIVRVLDREELQSELASAAYHGGIVDDLSAGLNPARYAVGLARGACRHGAVVSERTHVQKIERTHQAGAAAFRVFTDRGSIIASDVFVATGAYTTDATPELRRCVVPVGSYVIATEPLGKSAAAALIPRSRMVFDSNNFLHYYRLTPDWRVLFGGRAAFLPANEHTVRESATILRQGMLGVFPQLRDASIEYAWGGSIDFTFDMLPHAGTIDGVRYAIGYAGHGVAMATYVGTKMARVIGGEADDALATGPVPAPPLGLSGARPWFLPFAGAWYKLVDWAS